MRGWAIQNKRIVQCLLFKFVVDIVFVCVCVACKALEIVQLDSPSEVYQYVFNKIRITIIMMNFSFMNTLYQIDYLRPMK